MIQYSGADHVEGVLEGGGQRAIGLAGFRITGGMIVNQDHGSCIVFQGNFDYFPWVNAGTIQRASEQLPEANNPVFGI